MRRFLQDLWGWELHDGFTINELQLYSNSVLNGHLYLGSMDIWKGHVSRLLSLVELVARRVLTGVYIVRCTVNYPGLGQAQHFVALFANTPYPIIRDPMLAGDRPMTLKHMRETLHICDVSDVHELKVLKTSYLLRKDG